MGRLVFYSLLCLTVALPICYAWDTPFALIDDYSDWLLQRSFQSIAGFEAWVTANFLTFNGGRYRPYFDLTQGLSWIAFGPHPGLHHLVRIGVRIFTGLFLLGAYLQFCRFSGDSAQPGFQRAKFHGMAALLLLFILFPNNPEARLAPQELHTGFFLAGLVWIAGRILEKPVAASSNLLLYYIAFTGLALSKEVNLFVLPVCILVFHTFVFKRYRLPSAIIPVLIFFHTLAKIVTAYKLGGYGSKTVTLDLIGGNMKWIIQSILLIHINWIIALAFVALLLFLGFDVWIQSRTSKHIQGKSQGLMILLITVALLCAFAAGLTTSWLQVLRYWYPMMPLFVLILAISVFRLTSWSAGRRDTGRWAPHVLLPMAGIFFLSVWPVVLYQYVVQHHARNTEAILIGRLQSYRDRGEIIQLDMNEGEYVDKLRIFLESFDPQYSGQKPYAAAVVSAAAANRAALFVTRSKDILIPIEEIEFHFDYSVFKRALALTRKLGLIRRPEMYLDHGAEPYWAYNWYIGRVKK